MTTGETKREKWVSASSIVGALFAGLAAMAATRHEPAPRPAAPIAKPAPAPASAPLAPTSPPAKPEAQTTRPRVDLVFALDTTGSMSGLIEGAKAKIWSIASFVARAQPTPDVRVGLVAYRDIGDAYVTRVFDLDDDLDRVYRRLLSFRADGGGDEPEHVARALHQAVHDMTWSPRANNNVRLIYLVGDAPPHLDYRDGYDYVKAARAAAAQGIQIHAIRCGSDEETATVWRRIASLGHGEFLTINQDGGMHERRTPYDEELARLHDKLSDTVVAYGAGGAATRATLAAAHDAPASVKAARAGFLSAKEGEDGRRPRGRRRLGPRRPRQGPRGGAPGRHGGAPSRGAPREARTGREGSQRPARAHLGGVFEARQVPRERARGQGHRLRRRGREDRPQGRRGRGPRVLRG